jgi:hypothetical protein
MRQSDYRPFVLNSYLLHHSDLDSILYIRRIRCEQDTRRIGILLNMARSDHSQLLVKALAIIHTDSANHGRITWRIIIIHRPVLCSLRCKPISLRGIRA